LRILLLRQPELEALCSFIVAPFRNRTGGQLSTPESPNTCVTDASTEHLRVLTNSDVCRTRAIKPLGSVAECLVDYPGSCPYAMLAGGIRFCTHRDWMHFLNSIPSETRPKVGSTLDS
jgi:hypothetical protein